MFAAKKSALMFNGDWSCLDLASCRLEKALESQEKDGNSSWLSAENAGGFAADTGMPPWMVNCFGQIYSKTPGDFAAGFTRRFFAAVSPEHHRAEPIEQLFIACLIENQNIGVCMQLIPGYVQIEGRLVRSGNDCMELAFDAAEIRRKIAGGESVDSDELRKLEEVLPDFTEIHFDADTVSMVCDVVAFASSPDRAFQLAAKLEQAYVRKQQELAGLINGGMYRETDRYSEPGLQDQFWRMLANLLQDAVYKSWTED